MSARDQAARPDFGFVEWFRPGEHDRVLRAIEGMRAVGASFIRTHLSWATYHTPEGAAWYDWLIPTISRDLDLLLCVHYTPPSLSRTGRSSGPPRRLKDFPDFVDHVLTRYGSHFRHIELWNEPNNLLDWDWREDPDWLLFCEMIGAAAQWTRASRMAAGPGRPLPVRSQSAAPVRSTRLARHRLRRGLPRLPRNLGQRSRRLARLRQPSRHHAIGA